MSLPIEISWLLPVTSGVSHLCAKDLILVKVECSSEMAPYHSSVEVICWARDISILSRRGGSLGGFEFSSFARVKLVFLFVEILEALDLKRPTSANVSLKKIRIPYPQKIFWGNPGCFFQSPTKRNHWSSWTHLPSLETCVFSLFDGGAPGGCCWWSTFSVPWRKTFWEMFFFVDVDLVSFCVWCVFLGFSYFRGWNVYYIFTLYYVEMSWGHQQVGKHTCKMKGSNWHPAFSLSSP